VVVDEWNMDVGLERNDVERKQHQNKKLGMEAEWDLRVTVGLRKTRNRINCDKAGLVHAI
jgi:hypothetical protein